MPAGRHFINLLSADGKESGLKIIEDYLQKDAFEQKWHLLSKNYLTHCCTKFCAYENFSYLSYDFFDWMFSKSRSLTN